MDPTGTVMERDMRITGVFRGQSTNVVAPKGFEVSNPWKVWVFSDDVGQGADCLQLEKRIV